jgi:hypothetical protein
LVAAVRVRSVVTRWRWWAGVERSTVGDEDFVAGGVDGDEGGWGGERVAHCSSV